MQRLERTVFLPPEVHGKVCVFDGQQKLRQVAVGTSHVADEIRCLAKDENAQYNLVKEEVGSPEDHRKTYHRG